VTAAAMGTATSGPPPVFISYASPDREEANTLSEWMWQHGIACWLDHQNLRGGAGFDPQIDAAIRATEILVVLLSRRAVESRYVGHEVSLAIGADKVILYFRLEDLALKELGAPFNVKSSRHHLADKLGAPREDRYQALLRDIRFHLGRRRRQRRQFIALMAIAMLAGIIVARSLPNPLDKGPWSIFVNRTLGQEGPVDVPPEGQPATRPQIQNQPDRLLTPNRPVLTFDLYGLRRGASNFHLLRPDSQLAQGEHYFISAQPLTAGYLYIFQQDSSGKIQWLFPRNDTEPYSSGTNPVPAFRHIVLPEGENGGFRLDAQAGRENVIAVLSASRFPELEALLQSRQAPPLNPRQLEEIGRKGMEGVDLLQVTRPAGEAGIGLPFPASAAGARESWLVQLRSFEHVLRE